MTITLEDGLRWTLLIFVQGLQLIDSSGQLMQIHPSLAQTVERWNSTGFVDVEFRSFHWNMVQFERMGCKSKACLCSQTVPQVQLFPQLCRQRQPELKMLDKLLSAVQWHVATDMCIKINLERPDLHRRCLWQSVLFIGVRGQWLRSLSLVKMEVSVTAQLERDSIRNFWQIFSKSREESRLAVEQVRTCWVWRSLPTC